MHELGTPRPETKRTEGKVSVRLIFGNLSCSCTRCELFSSRFSHNSDQDIDFAKTTTHHTIVTSLGNQTVGGGLIGPLSRFFFCVQRRESLDMIAINTSQANRAQNHITTPTEQTLQYLYTKETKLVEKTNPIVILRFLFLVDTFAVAVAV